MGFVLDGLEAEEYDRNYGDGVLVRRILGYFQPHKRTLAIVAGSVALFALAETIIPVAVSRGIDALASNPTLQVLLALAGGILVLGSLGWFFNYIRQAYAAKAVGDVVLALREDAFSAVMQRDLSFYDQYASGKIVSRVTSDTQDFSTVVTLTVELVSQFLLIAIITAVLFTINTQLTLITLAVTPVVFIAALAFRRIARWSTQRGQRATAEVNATIQETVSGIAVAKNFRQEAAIYDDFRATNSLVYRARLMRGLVINTIFPTLDIISGIATALIVYFGGRLAFGGELTAGEWYLYVQTLAIFLYPLTSIASFWSQFQQGLAASERVFALIDAEPRVVQIGQEPVGRIRGRIELKHIDFSYKEPEIRDQGSGVGDQKVGDVSAEDRATDNGQESGVRGQGIGVWSLESGVWSLESDIVATNDGSTIFQSPTTNNQLATTHDTATPPSSVLHPSSFVLRNFSLDIPAGQKLAVVGHTGAGKSSLVRLITRFYEFQGGQLLIDGRDIRTLDLGQYRRNLGLVPQVPFLFSGTVADNIRYGKPDATDADVSRAALRLGGGEWVGDLPNGLQTDVGERGARLSLGQRQLVALARVLLQDPAIFILDEATASVDPFTEAQIQEGLDEVMRERTSISIAHRLSTVRNADRIIVMKAGQIIEEGTHDDLLLRGGHYAELYNTYFRHQSLEYIEQVGMFGR
jgi:ABC-type multidrug transport system fused ATPase/permease subunit